ncbi:hypothetical protein H7849_11845 [Alloacidobacterium dinghuense]|uniref:Uncharacterized protein n=1 Tax=Alloacidobacterium dinghuense TaxID=2763107 RepID=A0A7G8BPP8_9BACT|nr:hypothetical protein [Alloacidobacterium dinghuense]QNI34518.1 hypothetical protein H7849_11845 [Alloacidobacterium dinghuense]
MLLAGFALLAGVVLGIFASHIFGSTVTTEIKTYIEKLLQGIETRISEKIAGVEQAVTGAAKVIH